MSSKLVLTNLHINKQNQKSKDFQNNKNFFNHQFKYTFIKANTFYLYIYL